MKKSIIGLLLSILFLNGYGQEEEKENKVYVNAELVFSAGVGNVRIDNSILDANYERTYAAKLVAGKEILHRLSAGGMIMYDYYSESGFLLVGSDLRYALANSGDFGVFFSAAGGYGFVLGDDDRSGGLFLYPSIGTTVALRENYALLFSLGYKRQYFKDVTGFETLAAGETIFVETENDYSIGFLSFSVGVQF
jgi:hypothetical protein